MTRYVKWHKPRGGVKHLTGPRAGEGRTCMHCGRSAVHAAVSRNGKFTMDVWFCDDHKEVALEVGDK